MFCCFLGTRTAAARDRCSVANDWAGFCAIITERRPDGASVGSVFWPYGHSQVATTHRYAAADVEMMRRGLDKAGVSGKHADRFEPKDAVLRLLENA